MPRLLGALPARKRLRCAATAALIALTASCTQMPALSSSQRETRMPADPPLVIAHRGASAYRPEHTLASYALAIEQGADVIEPDLVVTRDGVLICRHENEIGGSTDVASHPEFAARRTRKRVDGEDIDGWFAEDFSLAEIRTLRARERLPQLRPDSARHDGDHAIPTFADVIALAAQAPRPIAIYPETKHPTYFAHEGRHLDGTPISRSLGRLLIEQLERSGFTDPARIYVQSFELANLIELRDTLLPAAGIELRLMQLFGDTGPVTADSRDFALPYDLRWHVRRNDDLDAIYPGLRAALPALGQREIAYADLTDPAVLRWMHERYAHGIAPWKDNLLPRNRMSEGPPRLDGSVSPLIARAHAAGLKVHTYTLRDDAPYRVADGDGRILTMTQELTRLLDAGIDGFFTDFPDLGAAARDARRGRVRRGF